MVHRAKRVLQLNIRKPFYNLTNQLCSREHWPTPRLLWMPNSNNPARPSSISYAVCWGAGGSDCIDPDLVERAVTYCSVCRQRGRWLYQVWPRSRRAASQNLARRWSTNGTIVQRYELRVSCTRNKQVAVLWWISK